MKYIFSLSNPYSIINHVLCRTDVPLEFSAFGDIILNYVQACVHRWMFGGNYDSTIKQLQVGLKYWLSPHELNEYIQYLDSSFWPMINRCIDMEIESDTSVHVSISPEATLVIEIHPAKTALEAALDRMYIDVEHKLECGEYIHPTIMEIYNASKCRL